MSIPLGLTFLAGLASFLSPCVLSLVPAYVGYLGGRSTGMVASSQSSKWHVFSHGLAFVIGFSFVFVVFGAAATAIGGLLYTAKEWLPRIGGVIVILFGLHLTGIIRFKFLEYDLRPQTKFGERRGYFSSVLMGIFFSFGWSPCVGPILGAILTALATSGMSILDGVKYLSVYSTGLAIPFLLAALGIGWVMTLLRKYAKAMHYLEIVMGIILIIVGIALFLNLINQVQLLGPGIDFGI